MNRRRLSDGLYDILLDYGLSDIDYHYVYHVCPKCATIIETEIFNQEYHRHSDKFTVYCWSHDAKIEAKFVMASDTRQKKNKSELLKWADKYEKIDKSDWEIEDETDDEIITVNCPQCKWSIYVPFFIVMRDGKHGATNESINCRDCSFHGPVRIRGLFQ